MARFAIFSLLALFFMASCASATTLEELCKGTYDAGFCLKLLKPTVMPETDFNSTNWHKIVLSRAVTRALVAKDFIAKLPNVPKSNEAALDSCTRKLHNSVKYLREALVVYGLVDVTKKLDLASANLEACSDLLEDAGEAMAQVRVKANEAAAATHIAKDLI